MSQPNPNDFTVEIKQRADGTWRVQIREEPAFWGEGVVLTDALEALRSRAVPKVLTTGSPDLDTRRGAAAVFAAESAVERYIEDGHGDEADDNVGSWDDVSVITFRRKGPASDESP